MEFRILGPLEARDGERRVDLGGPRPRALLALLVLDAGAAVATDRLVDELWGESPPRSASHLLHVYVSSLRKALGTDGPRRLVARAPGYLLEADAEEVDARRFERLVGEGRRLLAGGEPERAAATLRTALGLWRGPALADFTYEPFAQAEIARLEELRLVAHEDRIDADLALGRERDLVGELQALVAVNPLREQLRGQLMLALYRCDRQAEALEAYREARRALLDELGIEPSPRLKRLEQAILQQDPALEADPIRERVAVAEHASRKLLTVLVARLADVAGDAADDPEARFARANDAFAAARAILTYHGASVERVPDDRLMAVFGIPAGHDDDALRGVRAATELRERLELSSGIETGEAIVEGPTVSGDAVACAFRLSSEARTREILVGTVAHRLVRHAVLAERDSGRDATSVLALLTGAPPLERRSQLPLVGRERELGELRTAFQRAVSDRRLAVLSVTGEAGVGKSRLVQELASSLPLDAAALVGRCIPYGEGITYWPLREIVQRTVGVVTRETLLGVVSAAADREAIVGGVLAAIADEPARTREESFWAFRRLLEELARERPLLVVFEDVHWAEPTFLDFVDYLAGAAPGAPAVVLCLARPELLERRLGWDSGLKLAPLSPEESGQLVVQLLRGSTLPGEARARIVEAAEGNPLFMEQTLAMLAEDERSLDEVALPVSLRAVLAARLDRLGPAERAVVERASVVGRDVHADAVAVLLPEDAHASLDRHLQALLRKDYLRERGDRLRFAHALVQEAAYRGIPKQVRAGFHERLGDWLGETGEGDELVGYHLERAFRLREELREVDWHARRLATRAAERLGGAGRRALARDDPSAASNLLGRGVALLSEDAPLRVELLPDLVAAVRELPDLPRAEELADDAIAAATAVDDPHNRLLARIERAHVRLMRAGPGSVDEALAEADRAIADAGELGDDLALARAWRLRALANRLVGRQTARREALEHALVHVRRTADRRTEAWIMDGLGGVHSHGPSPVSDILRFAKESLEWSRANGERFNEAHALAQGFGRAHAMQGDFDGARRFVAEARVIVEDLGFVWHRAALASAAGYVELLAGDAAAAERELRAGYELVERSHMTGSYFALAVRDELAQALYSLGRYEEADLLARTSERDAGEDDVQGQVLWRALRGKLLARAGRFEEAEEPARAAVALAAGTEFLLVHANAVRDLGETLWLAARPQEARPVLEEARRLYARKGDQVSAKRMRAALAQLDVGPPAPALTRR